MSVGSIHNKTVVVTPSATQGVAGASVAVAPSEKSKRLLLTALKIVPTGVAGETLSIAIIFNKDGSAATKVITFSDNTPIAQPLCTDPLIEIRLWAESTIANSVAEAQVSLVGLEGSVVDI